MVNSLMTHFLPKPEVNQAEAVRPLATCLILTKELERKPCHIHIPVMHTRICGVSHLDISQCEFTSTKFKPYVNHIDRFCKSRRVQEHEQDNDAVAIKGKPASNMGELANILTIPMVFP